MFGFLNLLLTAAFLRAGLRREDAAALLEEADPTTLHFDCEHIYWRSYQLELPAVTRARREIVRSFGSCSFTEPIDDLKAMHLL